MSRAKTVGTYRRLPSALAALLLCWLALVGISRAESNNEGVSPTPPPSDKTGIRLSSIDFGGGYSYDGYRNWDGPYLRGTIKQNADTSWTLGVARVASFSDSGALFLGGLTRYFGSKWWADFNLASSYGGFYLPAFSTDATFHKKWLARGKLVTSFGLGYDHFKDEHNTYRWPVSLGYELNPRWRVEGGVSFAYTKPNPSASREQFVSISYGRDRKYSVSVRGEFGHQSYEIIPPNVGISDFASHAVSVNWRQWLRRDFGFNVGAEYYSSVYYPSRSVNLGFFKDF